MWKLKKVIASVIALASMVGCITTIPLNVNAATTYQKGDINGDGLVNNTDTQWARQFLLGMASTNDGATVERLDVNQNGIIDENDVDIIRNIVLHVETNSTLTSKDTTALPSQVDREYYVYDAKSGKKIDSESYTLKASDVNSITSVSSRSIIGGVDERSPEDNLKGVVKIITGSGINENRGTAFVVDSHTLLTAGHCVISSSSALGETKIQFYNDYDQVDTTINVTPLKYHIPKIFAVSKDSRYDYAIVTVKEDLSQYVNFTLGVARDCVINASNPTVYATGFSSITNADDISKYPGVNEKYINGDKVTGYGKLLPEIFEAYRNYRLCYSADVLPGNSGGPLYVTSVSNGKINRTVIGIVNEQRGYYNASLRVTTDILQFVYNNEHL